MVDIGCADRHHRAVSVAGPGPETQRLESVHHIAAGGWQFTATDSRSRARGTDAFAKQSLVQGLYEQRNALLDTQRKAEQALIELEQRLAALHLPQQERICAYEDRIAELEKELETRDDEVRELTRATLLLVRRKLQEEKGLGRQRDQFN